jgi:hypothetical protein
MGRRACDQDLIDDECGKQEEDAEKDESMFEIPVRQGSLLTVPIDFAKTNAGSRTPERPG